MKLARPKKMIAVIDDDPITRSFLKFNLDISGYYVAMAQDWNEGRLLLEYFKPDLLIVDGILPKYTGVDICRAIRRRPDQSELRTILLTSFFKGAHNAKMAQQKSCVDLFVRKPIESWKLLEVVQKLIGPGSNDEECVEIVPANKYRETQKACLERLHLFERVAYDILAKLDRKGPMSDSEWKTMVAPILEGDFSEEENKDSNLRDNVDVRFCEDYLRHLMLSILAHHRIDLKDPKQFNDSSMHYINQDSEGT